MEVTSTYGSTDTSGLSGGAVAVIVIAAIVLGLLHIIGYWKTLNKGGEPGPMALLLALGCLAPLAFIPTMKLIGRPAWWVILLFIPFVNIVVLAIISIDLAKSYGKGTGFGIGLWLLAPIFYMILGFGSSTYRSPTNAAA